MTEQTTPLEKLQLNGRYYRCLYKGKAAGHSLQLSHASNSSV